MKIGKTGPINIDRVKAEKTSLKNILSKKSMPDDFYVSRMVSLEGWYQKQNFLENLQKRGFSEKRIKRIRDMAVAQINKDMEQKGE